jgi:hypothetical protein
MIKTSKTNYTSTSALMSSSNERIDALATHMGTAVVASSKFAWINSRRRQHMMKTAIVAMGFSVITLERSFRIIADSLESCPLYRFKNRINSINLFSRLF